VCWLSLLCFKTIRHIYISHRLRDTVPPIGKTPYPSFSLFPVKGINFLAPHVYVWIAKWTTSVIIRCSRLWHVYIEQLPASHCERLTPPTYLFATQSQLLHAVHLLRRSVGLPLYFNIRHALHAPLLTNDIDLRLWAAGPRSSKLLRVTVNNVSFTVVGSYNLHV